MKSLAESQFISFSRYVETKENNSMEQPHTISADPPLKLPAGLVRLNEAFKKGKEVSIGKEIDPKGGEKDVTLKAKKLFIVGGAVRDYLLGHTPKNYDLVTDAHPEEAEKIILNARPAIQLLKNDKKKGSLKVSVDGETYTIETMRKGKNEEDQSPIYTANPGEDCERRDFTINALYYDISGNKIIDHCGGIRHLQDGAVKFIGRTEDKVTEDGMRKYRYARMVNKVPNGKVDKDTKEAFGRADSEEQSPDAIRDEFWKGMEDLHTNADKYLKTYQDLGLLPTVFPKLTLSTEFPTCKTCKSRPIVLASLLKNNKPQKLVEKLKELKYTDREIKDAVFLINLLVFTPELIADYTRELLTCSLTRRQIMDWAKTNSLDMDLIEKLLEHKLSGHADVQGDSSSGEGLKERMRRHEAEVFMRSLRS